MSKIAVTPDQLRDAARDLWGGADSVVQDNPRMLLRFYSVECVMKARFLRDQKHPDTSKLDKEFGSSGHDLSKGIKALGLSAAVAAAPMLSRGPAAGQVAIERAHQVWRYGVPHTGSDAVETWLKQTYSLLKDR